MEEECGSSLHGGKATTWQWVCIGQGAECMRVRELGEGLWETGALEAGPREQRSEQVCEENEPVNK